MDEAPGPPPPRIVEPAPHQVSFGNVVVRVPKGTSFVRLLIDGEIAAVQPTPRRRVTIRLRLPARDVTMRVGRDGSQRSSAAVGPVRGLPPGAFERAPAWHDKQLARKLRRAARTFPGTLAYYVQDLRTGAGASWNAAARFPAASTLKVGIAIEAMRTLRGPPSTGSRADVLLRHTLIHSGNRTANDLAVLIAGSTTAAATRINATMRRLGLTDTAMYGGYLVESERRTSISVPLPAPIEQESIPKLINSQPSFGRGKYTTAADLAQLFRVLHLGASGRGPLIAELGGEVTPAESRYLLYLLAHSAERSKLARGDGQQNSCPQAGLAQHGPP